MTKFYLPSPDDYCAWCGELLADFGLDADTAPTGDDGALYCCDECRRDGENALQDARYCSAIPPDYND
jgi:hypothetical protein